MPAPRKSTQVPTTGTPSFTRFIEASMRTASPSVSRETCWFSIPTATSSGTSTSRKAAGNPELPCTGAKS
uniref:HflC n=1 Tax=uncultured bacterium pFosLip TaxID=380391 RepID=Q1KL77_9BACT|nr:HflC [uncultured bacterium pFosLip]